MNRPAATPAMLPCRLTSAPFNPTNSNTATFTFEASQASSFTCRLDRANAGSPTACDPDRSDPRNPAKGAKTYRGLGEGPYTFVVTAEAGGETCTASFSWVVDVTPPTVSFAPPSPEPNAHGWNNTDVVIAFTARDALTGIDPDRSTPSPLVLSKEGGAVTGIVTARDLAGNSVSVPSPSARIDRTGPTVAVKTPTDGAIIGLNQRVIARYTCGDTLSGVATCTGSAASGGPSDTGTLGEKIFTVTARDRAGNLTTHTVAYSVAAVPAADLLAIAVSAPPAAAEPGARLTLTDSVLNQGSAKARASQTRYYLGAQLQRGAGDLLLIGGRPVPALDPGGLSTGSATVTIPGSATLGPRFLIACADDSQVVDEGDEDNNCRASNSSIAITRTIDLSGAWGGLEHSCSGSTAKGLRCRLEGTFTLRNDGTTRAAQSRLRLYVSDDAILGSTDVLLQDVPVAAIDPGASLAKKLSIPLPEGSTAFGRFAIAVIDATDANAESDETNNHVPILAAPALRELQCDPEPTQNMVMLYGDRVTCRIDSGNDTDSFQFSGQVGDRVLIHARTLSGQGATCIQLFGRTLTQRLVLGKDVCASTGASIEATLRFSGPYTIQVHGGGVTTTIEYAVMLLKNP